MDLETGSLPDTIPTEEPHEESTTQDNAEGAPQPEDFDAAQDDSENSAQPTDESSFLAIRYNHEDMNLSREDAAKYAQIGMMCDREGINLDEVKPIMSKLDYVAAQSDISIGELAEQLYTALEETKLEELREKFGNDENMVNDVMSVYRNQQREKYETVLKNREKAKQESVQTVNQRLADEFVNLKAEYPEIKLESFAALPEAVRKSAASGMPLELAFLKHKAAEDKRIASQTASMKEAAERSAGSLSSDKPDSASEDEKRYLAALWGAE